jgi:hypothetical protein
MRGRRLLVPIRGGAQIRSIWCRGGLAAARQQCAGQYLTLIAQTDLAVPYPAGGSDRVK